MSRVICTWAEASLGAFLSSVLSPVSPSSCPSVREGILGAAWTINELAAGREEPSCTERELYLVRGLPGGAHVQAPHGPDGTLLLVLLQQHLRPESVSKCHMSQRLP